MQNKSLSLISNHMQNKSLSRNSNHNHMQNKSLSRFSYHMHKKSLSRISYHMQNKSFSRFSYHMHKKSLSRISNHMQNKSLSCIRNHMQNKSLSRISYHMQNKSLSCINYHMKNKSLSRISYLMQYKPLRSISYQMLNKSLSRISYHMQNNPLSHSAKHLHEPNKPLSLHSWSTHHLSLLSSEGGDSEPRGLLSRDTICLRSCWENSLPCSENSLSCSENSLSFSENSLPCSENSLPVVRTYFSPAMMTVIPSVRMGTPMKNFRGRQQQELSLLQWEQSLLNKKNISKKSPPRIIGCPWLPGVHPIAWGAPDCLECPRLPWMPLFSAHILACKNTCLGDLCCFVVCVTCKIASLTLQSRWHGQCCSCIFLNSILDYINTRKWATESEIYFCIIFYIILPYYFIEKLMIWARQVNRIVNFICFAKLICKINNYRLQLE